MKVIKKSLSEVVADDIIEIIKFKKMKSGDKLPKEDELCSSLNISRSTLREALKILTSRNILTIRQGAGIFIHDNIGIVKDPFGLEFLDKEELILDMLDTRLILEPEIAALAAINATEEVIEKISKQCDKVEVAIKNNEYYADNDILFHKYICEASGNRVINQIIPIVHSSIHDSIDMTNNKMIDNTIFYHRKIVEAIKRKDPVSARYAMINHLSVNRQAILDKRFNK